MPANSIPAASRLSSAFWFTPSPSVSSTASPASPMLWSLVCPVPQTQVRSRKIGPMAAVLYSPTASAPGPPLLPWTRALWSVHSEPHSTTMTVLVAVVRPPVPPASRVQLMVLVPDGKIRAWQTLWFASMPSAVSQPGPLNPPMSITLLMSDQATAEASTPATAAPAWATRWTSRRRKPLVAQSPRHSTTVTTPTQEALAAPRVSASWLAAMPPAKSPVPKGSLVMEA